ncbi:unnamed protein product, partial [Rotaria magnacalcarata]
GVFALFSITTLLEYSSKTVHSPSVA